MLQVVATATVAAYIGLGGLGRYLIDGIALGDYPETAGGAILVAVLAVVLDGVFALVQRGAVSPGLTGARAAPDGAVSVVAGRIRAASRLRPTGPRPMPARPPDPSPCSIRHVRRQTDHSTTTKGPLP